MHISESASSDSISGELMQSQHPTSPYQQPLSTGPPAAPTSLTSHPQQQLSPAGPQSSGGGLCTGSVSPNWSADSSVSFNQRGAYGSTSGVLAPPTPMQGVCGAGGTQAGGGDMGGGQQTRRQKSCDALDQTALARARAQKNNTQMNQVQQVQYIL